MPDSKPILRTLAVGSSIALAAFVIVRAQSGCDAPTERATPTPAAAPDPAPVAPTPATPPAVAPDPPAEPEPPVADTKVEAKAELASPVTPKSSKPKPPKKEEKKFFPASKSGIDFGHREPKAEPQAPQQQANPAPQ